MKDITKILNIKYPIIQGGMAHVATHKLAASVSNAGGLGLIGVGGWDEIKVRDEIKKCQKMTSKPFGVNLMLLNPRIKFFAL